MIRPFKRDADALSAGVFDLCIIGGGITGVCVAHDAAARGLKVALVERGDFAEGTTSASTKLIHGGTRYLEHYEFGLVRESLRERRMLMRLAPHMVRPLPFLIPLYRGGPVPAYLIRTGMLAYDVLSLDKNRKMLTDKRLPCHRFVSTGEALALEPELRPEGLKGASIYWDAQMPNPMRLCLEFAKTAAANGAQLANYAQVTALRRQGSRVTGVEVLDKLTGKSFAVTAALTVNCAGVWAGEIMKLLGTEPPVTLRPSKGIHLVTRAITRAHAVVSLSRTGRRIMIIPWRGKSLIGTTDDFYDGPLDRVRPNREEVEALLEEIETYLASGRVSLSEVEHGYAGVRPLIYRPGKPASDLSRSYKIIDHGRSSDRPGMISVLGGKYTTSRKLAQAVVNLALRRHLRRAAPCPTAHLFVGGGETGIVEEYLSRQEPAARGLIDRECLAELIGSYGTRWVDVLEYVEREPRLGQRVVPERPFILAQIHHAVEQEMATSVADVALRRTDLCNLGDRDGRITRAVAAEAQSVLNVSDEERQKQAQECLDQLVVEGLDLPDPHLFE